LNDVIAAWAPGVSTEASPVLVVDQYSGFNASAGQDTGDGVHPNDAGLQKMADQWFAAIEALF